MNWKNVLFLLRVERKSGRLIRGVKTTKYRENRFLAYWPYWLALVIGVVAGLIANFVVSLVYSNPSSIPGLPPLNGWLVERFCNIAHDLVNFQLCIYAASANPGCRHQSNRPSYVLAAHNVAGTNVGIHLIQPFRLTDCNCNRHWSRNHRFWSIQWFNSPGNPHYLGTSCRCFHGQRNH